MCIYYIYYCVSLWLKKQTNKKTKKTEVPVIHRAFSQRIAHLKGAASAEEDKTFRNFVKKSIIIIIVLLASDIPSCLTGQLSSRPVD